MKAAPHPFYADCLSALKSAPHLFQRKAGHAFRFGNLKYCKPEQILSGAGSYRWGARYNAIGSFNASYMSLSKATAVAESDANAAYYGFDGELLRPRLLVAVEFKLSRVLDLANASTRTALGIGLREMVREDWRQQRDAGFESKTQALGRAAFEARTEAMLVASACVPDGVNLVVFPENLDAGSVFRVCNEEELGLLRRT